MTLDEAIKHAIEVAEENQAIVDSCDYYGENMAKCEECAAEHRQLATWLKELKKDREILTELDAMIDCYENCESCQGFREYPTSQFIKDVIQINKKVNADE